MATIVKKVDFAQKQFEANGTTYFIETDGLSIARFEKYQELEIESGYGRTIEDINRELEAMHTEINKNRQIEAHVRLYNLRRGLHEMKTKEEPWLRIAALFINTADEDRAECSEDLLSRKIADWRKEGLSFEPFFLFAVSSSRFLSELYRKSTQTTLIEKAEGGAAEKGTEAEKSQSTSVY